ncbi:MAG: 3-deoxy-manno-octulosonate cytidylyltransferase [Candidatus Krumholzibacteriota bacterium]|nr:3-deoxy-manno-octulosonate cytidylyltransferase [Candidatus Krumholzibacteriota bacterium]
MPTTRVLAIIPARYSSTRFPGKPLAVIDGLPMILHVVRRTCRIRGVDRVMVATDDRRIKEVVEADGAQAVMTSPSHRTGTSRIAEVAERQRYGIILNIQGDEPLLPRPGVERLIETMKRERGVLMGTLCSRSRDRKALLRPDVVKVARGLDGNALYFSRSPVPFQGEEFLWHIGVYAYRRRFLLRYESLKRGPLENSESLEQLRALENGYPVRVLICRHRSLGVDRPADIKRVEKILKSV